VGKKNLLPQKRETSFFSFLLRRIFLDLLEKVKMVKKFEVDFLRLLLCVFSVRPFAVLDGQSSHYN